MLLMLWLVGDGSNEGAFEEVLALRDVALPCVALLAGVEALALLLWTMAEAAGEGCEVLFDALQTVNNRTI